MLVAAGAAPERRDALPFRRKVFPGWVPAGILSLCGPSRVGTSTDVPSAAWAIDMGISQTTSVSCRWKMGCSRTWITT